MSDAPGYVRLTLSEWDVALEQAEQELDGARGSAVPVARQLLKLIKILRQGQVRGTFVRD